MDGVHDMGGMHGFGPIPYEKNEPVFHEPWEGRVYAMGAASLEPISPSLDASRHALENLPPAVYLGLSYYERWLYRMQLRLIELGRITEDELEDRMAYYREHPDAPVPQHSDPAVVERAQTRYTRLRERLARPDGEQPHFKVGDAVHTRNIHPLGHTRLPRYARGKNGVIVRVYGSHDFPDTNAHGLGTQPNGLYNVRFEAAELWGPDAEGRGAVHLDLWERYLESMDKQAP
jgi:nitrile hydratase subunit beta